MAMAAMGHKDKAEALVRSRLESAPTANMWLHLGDLTGDLHAISIDRHTSPCGLHAISIWLHLGDRTAETSFNKQHAHALALTLAPTLALTPHSSLPTLILTPTLPP